MEEMQAIAEKIGMLLALRKDGSISMAEENTLVDWLIEQDQRTLNFMSHFTELLQGERDLDTYGSIDVEAALQEVLRRIFFFRDLE